MSQNISDVVLKIHRRLLIQMPYTIRPPVARPPVHYVRTLLTVIFYFLFISSDARVKDNIPFYKIFKIHPVKSDTLHVSKTKIIWGLYDSGTKVTSQMWGVEKRINKKI